jgi:hypothetical protein
MAGDVTPPLVEGDGDLDPFEHAAHGRTSPCARTMPGPFCGTGSSSDTPRAFSFLATK